MFLKVPAMLGRVNARTNAEVGRLIRARRRELGMTEADLQSAAKIDNKTLKALESGTRKAQEKTQLKIEPALGWAPGSIERLHEGRAPIELPEVGAAVPTISVEDLTNEELAAEILRRMNGEQHAVEAAPQPSASPEADKVEEDEPLNRLEEPTYRLAPDDGSAAQGGAD